MERDLNQGLINKFIYQAFNEFGVEVRDMDTNVSVGNFQHDVFKGDETGDMVLIDNIKYIFHKETGYIIAAFKIRAKNSKKIQHVLKSYRIGSNKKAITYSMRKIDNYDYCLFPDIPEDWIRELVSLYR